MPYRTTDGMHMTTAEYDDLVQRAGHVRRWRFLAMATGIGFLLVAIIAGFNRETRPSYYEKNICHSMANVINESDPESECEDGATMNTTMLADGKSVLVRCVCP